MKHVFVSHASADRKLADEIRDLLEKRGIECWIAPRDIRPGSDYAEQIIRGIEGTAATVLVLSEKANESTFVKNEIERAVSKGKPVFPVRVRQVLPSAALELFVSSSHWIDAWQPPIDATMDQLADAIRPLTGIPALARPSRSGAREQKVAGGAMGNKALKVIAWVVPAVLVLAGAAYIALELRNSKTEADAPRAPAVAAGTGGSIPASSDLLSGSALASPSSSAQQVRPGETSVEATPRADPARAPTSGEVTAAAFAHPPAAEGKVDAVKAPVGAVLAGDAGPSGNAASGTVTGAAAAGPARDVVTLLGTSVEWDRTKAITQLEANLPKEMSAGDVSAILTNTSGAARIAALATLAPYLKANLAGKDIDAVLAGLKGWDRVKATGSLINAKRVKDGLAPDEAIAILRDETSPPRVDGIAALAPYLKANLAGKDIDAVLADLKGWDRVKATGSLIDAKRVKDGLAPDEAVAILRDETSPPRVDGIAALAPYLKADLAGTEVVAVLGGLKGWDIIKSVEALAKANKTMRPMKAGDVDLVAGGMTGDMRVRLLELLAK